MEDRARLHARVLELHGPRGHVLHRDRCNLTLSAKVLHGTVEMLLVYVDPTLCEFLRLTPPCDVLPYERLERHRWCFCGHWRAVLARPAALREDRERLLIVVCARRLAIAHAVHSIVQHVRGAHFERPAPLAALLWAVDPA